MHAHMVQVVATAALLALLANVPTAAGECCGPTTYQSGNLANVRCPDCKQPQSNYCGAYGGGGCNAFGCNCGNGCIQPIPGLVCSSSCCDRHDRRARRHITRAALSTPAGNYSGHDVINLADLDKDGHLDEVEVHLYLTQRGVVGLDVTSWRQLDADADGRLTAPEIDNDLRGLDDVTSF